MWYQEGRDSVLFTAGSSPKTVLVWHNMGSFNNTFVERMTECPSRRNYRRAIAEMWALFSIIANSLHRRSSSGREGEPGVLDPSIQTGGSKLRGTGEMKAMCLWRFWKTLRRTRCWGLSPRLSGGGGGGWKKRKEGRENGLAVIFLGTSIQPCGQALWPVGCGAIWF